MCTEDDSTAAVTPSLQSVPAAPTLETDSSSNDNDASDADSAIDEWRSNRTQSISTSVIEGIYGENGRRYQAYRDDSHYHLPNDESEQDRLDLQHHLFTLALDGHFFRAPIPKENVQNVLDVGTGTGLWAMDVADHLPNAQVLGFDLSPIQPDMVPPNCKFIIDDCNAEWLFNEKFDLIHTRAMTPGVKDWPRYLHQAYENLKPGGFIELHEFVGQGHSADPNYSSNFSRWFDHAVSAGIKVGFDFRVAYKLEHLLAEAGYENINFQWQNWPIGPWAKGRKNKEIGKWWLADTLDATRNTSALFTRVLGWSQEEFDVFAAQIANELKEGKVHQWVQVCFAYAQKPLPQEE